MTCPNCNNNIPDGLKFCSECGANLINVNEQNNNIPPQNNPSYYPQNDPAYYPQNFTQGPTGEEYATTSLRFGIVGTCMDVTVFLSIVGLILGIVGIKKASNASRMGVKSGKQKAGLILSIISLVLSVVIPFVFLAACVDRAKKNSDASAIVSNAENGNLATALQGTYVGSNGSVLVLRDDMTSNYYYPGYGISTNTWTLKDNKLEMFISNCLCSVEADIDPSKTDSICLTSSSILWDEETFTKVAADTEKPTEQHCDELINQYAPNTSLANKTSTTTAATTKATEAQTTTATTASNSSQGTTVNDMTVKEALDEYEAYVDKYVELYKGMLDGSLNYFEALEQITELEGEIDELEKAMNSLSEADMTPEEYQYYIEVMGRVSEKMLSIYQ